jgi:hypothetical protein
VLTPLALRSLGTRRQRGTTSTLAADRH